MTTRALTVPNILKDFILSKSSKDIMFISWLRGSSILVLKISFWVLCKTPIYHQFINRCCLAGPKEFFPITYQCLGCKAGKSWRACFPKYMIRLPWGKMLQPQNLSFVFLGRLGFILFWTLNFLPGGGGCGIRINFRWGPIRSEWKKIFKIHVLKLSNILGLKKESFCLFLAEFQSKRESKKYRALYLIWPFNAW